MFDFTFKILDAVRLSKREISSFRINFLQHGNKPNTIKTGLFQSSLHPTPDDAVNNYNLFDIRHIEKEQERLDKLEEIRKNNEAIKDIIDRIDNNFRDI